MSFVEKLTRRKFSLKGLALAMTIGLAGQAAAQDATKLDKVTMALPFPIATYVVLVLGKDLGIFEKNGIDLDIQYIQPGPLEPALYSGAVHFTILPGPVSHEMTLAKTGVTTIMTYVKRVQNKMMVDKSITSLTDLNGKVVAVTRTGASMVGYLLLTSLREVGLDPDRDVQQRPISTQGDMMNALLSGQVSAVVLGPPFFALAEAQGARTLVDYTTRDDLPWPTANLVALESFLEANPELTTRFVKAMLESLDAWEKRPDEAKVVLQREAKIERPGLVDLMYAFSKDMISTGKDAMPTEPEHQAAIDMLAQVAKNDPAAKSPEGWKPSDFYDTKYVEAALAR